MYISAKKRRSFELAANYLESYHGGQKPEQSPNRSVSALSRAYAGIGDLFSSAKSLKDYFRSAPQEDVGKLDDLQLSRKQSTERRVQKFSINPFGDASGRDLAL